MNVSSFFVNDFESDLKWSEMPVQYIQYMQAIVYWWSDIEGWDRITDLLQQKKGKDIILTTKDGEIKLQFKSRRNDYGDFLIEYMHRYYTGGSSPGWIEKKEEIDYLIYCVPKKLYRIEWNSLVKAWRNNRTEWIAMYGVPPAANHTYDTYNVCIPWSVLRAEGVVVDEVIP